MSERPDAETFMGRLFKTHGGAESLFAKMQERLDGFNARWSQDIGAMGRVLRAHLFVEFYLTAYLQRVNPNLGSLRDVRLTFANKLDLVGQGNRLIWMLVPGIRRLNVVRNRLVHNLRVSVTVDDVNAFMSIKWYKAMRAESERRSESLRCEPLDVLEHFAKFAAASLDHASAEDAEPWRGAFTRPDM